MDSHTLEDVKKQAEKNTLRRFKEQEELRKEAEADSREAEAQNRADAAQEADVVAPKKSK